VPALTALREPREATGRRDGDQTGRWAARQVRHQRQKGYPRLPPIASILESAFGRRATLSKRRTLEVAQLDNCDLVATESRPRVRRNLGQRDRETLHMSDPP
jgi:hypothetical protein